ncbi:SWIM zinc finger family protein [Amycolatopsis sp.]|uniref:SWIM zinc finger family protein n=1 Tax=Amycolatopsis sp. TaxID=37632 RepID=UPI002BD2B64C|nr:SWIM zinc finger family protein [Amycolatopsis sp.]HVV10149.1 SWIM zinc finger family protein [Amycolatopsis sp.]
MTPRRNFGLTWWGRAWAEALEGRAKLDPNRLPRGRTYARKGRVSALDVTAGEVRAWVRGSRSVPYRVTIRVQLFSEAQWESLLDEIVGRLGHAAALLDGELPEELAGELLPGPGDLRPRCSCPDSADPCKHSAAVCYLVADEVDADPFVLFLLRGRAREPLLQELRARRRTSAPVRDVPVVEGLAPRDAFARKPSPVPSLPAAPSAPGPSAVLTEPPSGSGLRVEALSELASAAAALACGLLTGEDEFSLSPQEDLARRAARGEVANLAAAAGMPAAELRRWASAWAVAGRGGLAVLRESWQPPGIALAEARAALDESPGETKVWRNRVTRGDLQLRIGRDERWYLFTPTSDGWLPAGPGYPRPLDALSSGQHW